MYSTSTTPACVPAESSRIQSVRRARIAPLTLALLIALSAPAFA